MQIPEKLFGIIGHPLGHSLSPVLHNWAFRELNLPYAYCRWPLVPENLADFITAVRVLPISGLSVTIPHKQTIRAFLDHETSNAEAIGAVNTLYWDNDVLMGENTDVSGFLSPLKGRSFSTALVLGAGGASRAVLAGLSALGVKEIFLTNRTAARAQALAAEFNAVYVPWEERTGCAAALLVNTTPLGMQGENQHKSPWPAHRFAPGQVAYDLVYNPQQTLFLMQAEEKGLECIDGLSMFVAQAALQFQLWTGRELPLDGARKLLREQLEG